MSFSRSFGVDHLQTFVCVVREGGFSAAALKLDVAQPTISGRVRVLEAAVGGSLLVRGGRRVSLTRRGERFMAYAEQALATLDEGVRAARSGDADQVGLVAVGVTDSSLADSFLGRAVAALGESHPGVSVLAEMGSCEHMVREVHDGGLQLALLPWPYASPLFDALDPLLRFREPLCVVASARHPLAEAGPVGLAQLIGAARPFLRLWWNQASTRDFDLLTAGAGATLEVPIQVARHTLLQGTGAALFAPSIVAHELEAGTLVRIPVTDLPELHCESALVTRRGGAELSPASQCFVEALSVAAGDLCRRSMLGLGAETSHHSQG